jgi:hypothetical protein
VPEASATAFRFPADFFCGAGAAFLVHWQGIGKIVASFWRNVVNNATCDGTAACENWCLSGVLPNPAARFSERVHHPTTHPSA